jgi:NAD(P)-dependent dehydrogenase (short-subunit alcohol dehydrogenase family)
VPNAPVEFLPLDLTSFESIAAAAETFKSKETRLDVLMNNAGVMAMPYSLTKDGYEIQFGTNHMGHALLTKLLMPVMLETAKEPGADVRIVNLSSSGHQLAPSGGIIYDQAALEKQGPWRRYGQAKLANILFSHELAARYPQITSLSVHPGVIITDLYTSVRASVFVRGALWLYSFIGPLLPGHFKDAKGGSLTQTWAVVAPKEGLKNGDLYNPIGVHSNGSSYAQDRGLAKKLWEWTEEELGKHGY